MEETYHSRDEIWKKINDQSETISEVRSGQAATDARLGALESAVDQGFRTLSSELRNISEKVHRPQAPPNYSIFVFLAIGLLGVFGGYALLITNPLADLIQKNYEQVTQLEDHRQRTAALEGKVEFLQELMKEQRAFMLEAAFIHGQNDERSRRND